MMAGDVHIVTVKRGLEGVVVPSKLYSILAAGRPVLAVARRNLTPRASSSNPAAASPPIPTILPPSPPPSANFARNPRAWPKWAGAPGKLPPNMLELNELKSSSAIIEDAAGIQLTYAAQANVDLHNHAEMIAFAIALLASLVLTVPVRHLALRYGMVDKPGPRKVH